MPSVARLLLGGDRLVVGRLALLAQEAGQPRALLLGDVRAVQTDEARRRGRQEQHVAAAEQLLGAVAVENRPRVDLRRHAERDARRQVGLDEPGDDVDRRPLRRENQVDADGARHLREPRDRLLDLVAGDHHQVGQLVDDDDDEGQRLGRLAVLRRPLFGDRLLDVAVVLLDVPDAFGRERLVALFHLAHRPAQRVRRLLGIDDDRRQQVGDVLVHPELQPLRIDHDHPHIVRRRAVEDARQHAVDADRLAGAGRSGDQQMRHGREIGHVRLAVNGLAERDASASTSTAGRPPIRAARAARSARGCGSGSGCRRSTCRECGR